jgi:hypothetical protein
MTTTTVASTDTPSTGARAADTRWQRRPRRSFARPPIHPGPPRLIAIAGLALGIGALWVARTVFVPLAAVFWAWRWGPIGLLLSTPLAVVPGRGRPERVRARVHRPPPQRGHRRAAHIIYDQRLLAGDEREAAELAAEVIEAQSLEAAFDGVLIPALSRAQRDHDVGGLTPDDRVALAMGDRLVPPDELRIRIAPAGGWSPRRSRSSPRVIGDRQPQRAAGASEFATSRREGKRCRSRRRGPRGLTLRGTPEYHEPRWSKATVGSRGCRSSTA